MIKKIRLLLFICLISSISLIPAYANANSIIQNEIAQKQITEFIQNKSSFISTMNSVANVPADTITEYTEEDGSIVTKEIRSFTNSQGIEVVNTRTYVSRGSTKSVTDSYGLYYMGIPDGGGTMNAQYIYSYEKIDSPNQMTTKFHSAEGYCVDLLDDLYEFINDVPRWDTEADYNVSADVTFHMRAKVAGVMWQDIDYKHTCSFDKYGIAHMSWFE
jgi:hypothetical protein